MKRIVIIAVLLVLAGCSVNSKQFSEEIRKVNFAKGFVEKTPELARCFGYTEEDAIEIFNVLMDKHFAATPIYTESMSIDDTEEYGGFVTRQALAEYYQTNRERFANPKYVMTNIIQHCREGFSGDFSREHLGLAKK